MTLSCIIPTLGRPKALERTLHSLDRQSHPPDEVIVVLQAGSPALPDERRHFPLRVLRQQEPNAQRARNDAALQAQADLLLFLDDDIEAEPDLIRKYLEAFEDPGLGAACGAILEPGQEPTVTVPAEALKEPLGWTRFPLHFGGDRPARNFSSCNTCVRRDVHIESGGFDEHFVATLFDDSDWSVRLCCRLQERGLRGMHLGGARLVHFREPAGGRRIERVSPYVKVDAEGWASRLYFWRKNYGSGAWGDMARFIRMDLLCGSLLVRPREMCRAWGEFLRGWRLATQRIAQGPKLLMAK